VGAKMSPMSTGTLNGVLIIRPQSQKGRDVKMTDTQFETGTENVDEVDLPEAEAGAAEETTTEAPATGAVPTGPAKPQLPEGVISPISALNELKRLGKAPQDYKSQQMYGFVKNPGKVNPFPVRHYHADGSVHNEPQISEHGVTMTRPGVKVSEVVEWWDKREVQLKEKAAAKVQKAKDDAAKAAAKAAGQPAPGTTAATSESAPEAAGEFPGEDVAAEDAE
jgi:hypothetical protein